MKKLNGMKKSFSSLENKKLKDLKSVFGGYAIKSNLVNEQGCTDTDYYDDNTGEYKKRAWLCIDSPSPTN